MTLPENQIEASWRGGLWLLKEEETFDQSTGMGASGKKTRVGKTQKCVMGSGTLDLVLCGSQGTLRKTGTDLEGL